MALSTIYSIEFSGPWTQVFIATVCVELGVGMRLRASACVSVREKNTGNSMRGGVCSFRGMEGSSSSTILMHKTSS
jgi:hypothetical protein